MMKHWRVFLAVAAAMSADPTCSKGALSSNGAACCAAECGQCGGSSCQDLPGGKSNCCVGAIKTEGRLCAMTDPPCMMPPPAPTKTPHHVLMIVVDDLRPVGKLLGEPEVQAPNLDRLAARSTIFTNAFTQSATCGVSRSSLLTGRRPDTTYVLENSGCPFTSAPAHGAWQSLPQYFRNAGYRTAGHGKIFHPNVCEGAVVGEQAAAWSSGYYHAPCIGGGSLYAGGCSDPAAAKTNPPPYYRPCVPPCVVTSAYANATATGDDMPDEMIAREAVRTIQRLAAEDSQQPFFVAVGFHKPHLPHIAPKRFFDLYPLENVSLPPSPRAPKGAPMFAWNKCGEWTAYPDVKNKTSAMGFSREQPVDDEYARQQRRAYFAAASFADAQVGRVLDAVEEAGLNNRTVVVLFGDHVRVACARWQPRPLLLSCRVLSSAAVLFVFLSFLVFCLPFLVLRLTPQLLTFNLASVTRGGI